MRFFLTLIALCGTAFGACHVILPAGSGAATGADWSNACNGACVPKTASFEVAVSDCTAVSESEKK
jgi:hypothetical protein